MVRITLRAAVCTLLVSTSMGTSAFAQSPSAPPAETAAPSKQAPAGDGGAASGIDQAHWHTLSGVPEHYHPRPIAAPVYLPPNSPSTVPNGYPYLNAPLYPVPRPDIPYQTGGAFITNQALDPHEMLYAHTYRSIYPPYYYEVTGGWKTLPWGVAQGEHWRLRGTVVTVKYRSSYGIFSGFCPPYLPNHWSANPGCWHGVETFHGAH